MQSGHESGGAPKAALLAWNDLKEGVARHALWMTLGGQEIRHRYRRSVLGPFWLTLAMLATIAGTGPLYGALLNIKLDEFIPYLSIGIIVWSLIATLITEGCSTFTASETMIKSMRLPFLLHAFRTIYRNLLVFAHNAMAYVPVILYLGIRLESTWLMALPGLTMIVLAALPVVVMLGIACARYRDIQQIVASVLQLAFFMTPILWKTESLGSRFAFASWNPLYWFIELVRAPLLGAMPAGWIYACAGAVTAGLYALAIPLFIRCRGRIAFWV